VLNRYVNTLRSFEGANYAGTRITAGEIDFRNLAVAIPDIDASEAQANALDNVFNYGRSVGVTVQYYIVEG
jgi:hypothetical protein